MAGFGCPPRRRGLVSGRRLGLAGVAGAPDPIGVLAIKERTVLAGVRDVITEAGEPLEWVHGLEVPSERRVHAGAVEDSLLPVEVVNAVPWSTNERAHDVDQPLMQSALLLIERRNARNHEVEGRVQVHCTQRAYSRPQF